MPNPWALVLLLIAIGCVIVAAKGTQDNLLSAVLGRQYGASTLGSSSSSSSTGEGTTTPKPGYYTIPNPQTSFAKGA